MLSSLILILILLGVGLALLLAGFNVFAANGAAKPDVNKRAWLVAAGLICWLGAAYLFTHPREPQSGDALATGFGEKELPPDRSPVSLSEVNSKSHDNREVERLGDGTAKLSSSAQALEESSSKPIEPALAEKQIIAGPTLVAESSRTGVDASHSVTRLQPIREESAMTNVPALPQLAASTGASRQRSTGRVGPRHSAPAPAPARASARRGQGTTIHILDALGEGQNEERLTLSIEGRPLANIAVNRSKPSVHVPLLLPRPGYLHYTLAGSALEDGYRRLEGSGCIEMLNGFSYEVRHTDDGKRLYLHRLSSRPRS